MESDYPNRLLSKYATLPDKNQVLAHFRELILAGPAEAGIEESSSESDTAGTDTDHEAVIAEAPDTETIQEDKAPAQEADAEPAQEADAEPAQEADAEAAENVQEPDEASEADAVVDEDSALEDE